jgi:cyclopropane-fatty-acyl-phospholipid synthase
MTVSACPVTRPAADPQRWPDVASVPRGRAPIRTALLTALVRPGSRKLGVRVLLPGGRIMGSADLQAPLMRLHRPESLYRRVIASGLVGFGESYQAGDWDADDLPALLGAMANRALTPSRAMQLLRRAYRRRPPAAESGTMEGARRNVQRHYDLSNDLFALFLDQTMTYSSALFESDSSGRPIAAAALLADAQRRKIDQVLDLARVGRDTRLLEIGTGWGELAIRAAHRGALVHTVTLSGAQRDLARERIAAAGASDQVTVALCDYRAIKPTHQGSYDAIVSVEMIEAVDEPNWPAYFKTLDWHLAQGGRAVLQAITMRHAHLAIARGDHTWIHKYIFPGGLIPSVRAIDEPCRQHTQLRMYDAGGFGTHYAQTLRLWRERFQEHGAEVAALGFDEMFRRTWHLYLSYAEAGFASGYLDVHHLVLERSRG